ncbi:uncharacterized protein LOC132625679 [Lycium barbarum]|uniref:uncharacterized protein LOC132625679 n=1 Tax=Lycium barbarum TaxID=112863 RepID=UPI00293E4FF8|nr:uncharacterized protein LOC132625679 [Lycium barbarum]
MRQAEQDIVNIATDTDATAQTAAAQRDEDLAHRTQEADRMTAMQGARNAKEVENFIFDIEQYFDAVGELEEPKKVATAAMYLQGDAKLWWRVKYEAIKAGEDALETWEELKAAIRLQFFPENVEYNARRKLRELRQTKSVRDYVCEFSALMLNIKDMGDKDKLFTFIEGLKPYARMEIQRQRVDSLPKAIQVAECLSDYQVDARKDRPQPPARGGFKGGQSYNAGPSRSGGDRSVTKSKGSSSGSNSAASHNNDRGRKPPQDVAQINAHQILDDGTDDDEDDADQTEPIGAFNALVCSISNAVEGTSAGICKKKDPSSTAKRGKTKAGNGPPPSKEKTLMFADLRVNGKPIKAMIDTGATHKYLATTEVERLGLVVGKGKGRVKAINSPPQLVGGIAKGVRVKMGPYEGKFDLRVVIIDDFDLIVGLEFMRQTNIIPIPYADVLLMMGANGAKPCIVPCTTIKMASGNISALQLKKGVQRQEPTFLATLCIEEIERSSGPIPMPVKELMKEFEDVMPQDMPKRLPPRRTIDHEIELVPGAKPPARAPYRMSQPELTEIRRQLTEMLDTGIIVPSKSPYGSPVLFQKKHDGTIRLCVDYKSLNKITVKNKYPIPLMADLFDRLGGATVFTKIDLKTGYWQVRIAEGDESKTTCVTRYGSFDFLVFREYIDEFVVVYLDDIVVYNKTLGEHLEYLRKVLNRLREHELYVKLSKCSFAQKQIDFLGHVVEEGRIKMDQQKIKAVTDWPPPKDIHALRAFLGLCNFYRRFVKNYSLIALPLIELLKKITPWDWSPKRADVFNSLKVAMSSSPVLALPDLTRPFEVETDASDYALGGVLLQEGHPVAYESRKLKDAERRYAAHEKELLDVVHCLRLWRNYLLGSPFVVKTDNTAVSHFMTQPNLNGRQARWQELLAEFHFNLEYRSGKTNHVANALS